MISHHAALIYTMVLVAAADREIDDEEFQTMGALVRYLPVFDEYDPELLPNTCEACAEMLDQDDGLEMALDLIKASLPESLRETAYALACDIAACDGVVEQEELRLLEMLRHRIDVERLHAAAIEKGTRARWMRHAPAPISGA